MAKKEVRQMPSSDEKLMKELDEEPQPVVPEEKTKPIEISTVPAKETKQVGYKECEKLQGEGWRVIAIRGTGGDKIYTSEKPE